ncbi:hypothetical protein ES703_101335 [subsurface metagenome]
MLPHVTSHLKPEDRLAHALQLLDHLIAPHRDLREDQDAELELVIVIVVIVPRAPGPIVRRIHGEVLLEGDRPSLASEVPIGVRRPDLVLAHVDRAVCKTIASPWEEDLDAPDDPGRELEVLDPDGRPGREIRNIVLELVVQ